MEDIYKGKTREEIIQLIFDLTLQNTNGRETHEEMYLKGIEACYDEMEEQQTKSLQEFNNYLLDLYTDRDSYSRGKLLDLVKKKAEELFG